MAVRPAGEWHAVGDDAVLHAFVEIRVKVVEDELPNKLDGLAATWRGGVERIQICRDSGGLAFHGELSVLKSRTVATPRWMWCGARTEASGVLRCLRCRGNRGRDFRRVRALGAAPVELW